MNSTTATLILVGGVVALLGYVIFVRAPSSIERPVPGSKASDGIGALSVGVSIPGELLF